MQKLTELQLLEGWKASLDQDDKPALPMGKRETQFRHPRHKVALDLFAAGVPLDVIARQMNWSAYTIREYYARWIIQQDQERTKHITAELRDHVRGMKAKGKLLADIAQTLGISQQYVRRLLRT